MVYSSEKRSTGSSDADQFPFYSRKKSKKANPSTEVPISDPENKSGISKVFGTDESSSKGQENVGSSGKRKHSRWDPNPQADEQNADDGVAAAKQRKTRWANADDGVAVAKPRKTRWANDDSQLKLSGPVHLPDFVKGSTVAANDPEFQELNQRLLDIHCKLNHLKTVDKLPGEALPCQKLIKEKQEIIRELVRKTSKCDVPSDIKAQKLCKKLYVPVKEYPEYNFIGLIIGPRGRTTKRMEMETGARIVLRGKGSSKRNDGKSDPSDDEDLHVLVEADSQRSLDAAVAMVEKLLVPVEDGKNKLKRSQLRELAELRGGNVYTTWEKSSKVDGTCEICGDARHEAATCPWTAPLPVTKADEDNFQCDTCGDAGHLTVACPFSGTLLQTKTHETNVNPLAALGDGFSHFASPPSQGNQPLEFRSSANSVPFGSDKSNRVVDYTNLYVAHLPQDVDSGRLVQLFSPFGALSDIKVIRDKATGLSKGYGFVKYIDPTSAAMAVNQMNGFRLDGNMLVVRIAGHQHGTPSSMQPVENMSISFPPAYPSSSATAHIPASVCWPGPPGLMLPETSNLMSTTHGSLHASPMPSSLPSALDATSEELAQFPGNPDNFASRYRSLFS